MSDVKTDVPAAGADAERPGLPSRERELEGPREWVVLVRRLTVDA